MSDMISREAAISHHQGQLREANDQANKYKADGDDESAADCLKEALVHSDSINALRALPPAQDVETGNPGSRDPVTLTYRNWRGETAERTIIPRRVWFGATDWHPEPQWLLTALDVEKDAERDFALKDFGHPAAPAMKLKQAAQVLNDLLHMKGRHHEGMTHADIEALWNAAKDGTGYAAVSAFLSAILHQTEVTRTLAALEGGEV